MNYNFNVVSTLLYSDVPVPVTALRKYYIMANLGHGYGLTNGPFNTLREANAALEPTILGLWIRQTLGYIIYTDDVIMMNGRQLSAEEVARMAHAAQNRTRR